MNHFGWLVLVVFALIWILNNFLRSGDEEKNANRRRGAGGRQGDGQAGRRKTEIEEFLEEVNRRRRQKTDQPQPSAEDPVPMRTPLAGRTTRPPSAARPEPRRQKQTQQVRTMAQREAERPVLAEAVIVMDERAPSTVGQTKLGQLTSVPERPAAAVQLTTMAPEIKAAPLVELTALLKSSEGMRAAIILQEVLGPPRCRRQLPVS